MLGLGGVTSTLGGALSPEGNRSETTAYQTYLPELGGHKGARGGMASRVGVRISVKGGMPSMIAVRISVRGGMAPMVGVRISAKGRDGVHDRLEGWHRRGHGAHTQGPHLDERTSP